jgi:hypothetical protein
MYQKTLVGDALKEGQEDPSFRHEPAAEANRPDGEARGRNLRRRVKWRRRLLAVREGADRREEQELGIEPMARG